MGRLPSLSLGALFVLSCGGRVESIGNAPGNPGGVLGLGGAAVPTVTGGAGASADEGALSSGGTASKPMGRAGGTAAGGAGGTTGIGGWVGAGEGGVAGDPNAAAAGESSAGAGGDNGWSADANGDGCVNALDYELVLKNYSKSGPQLDPRADVTRDGVVNDADIVFVVQQLGTGCPGH